VFAAPFALIVGLALAGGGFSLDDRHVAGILVWLVVIGLLIGAGLGARAPLARPVLVVSGLLVALALLSAISAFWSGSVERSVAEADRVLVYLGVFLAGVLLSQTELRRQRFVEGLTIAIAAVGLLGLASRLVPDVTNDLLDLLRAVLPDDSVETPFPDKRLRYPLGYWNANGVMWGIGLALLLWMSRNGSSAPLRFGAAGLMPPLLLAIYFNYSRGGVLAAAVGVGCLVALSRHRLWHLATLALAVLCAAPAILAVQDRRELADGLTSPAATAQGETVLAILAGGVLAALAGLFLLRRLAGADTPLTGRALALSRDRRVLGGLAIGAGVVALALVLALGGRVWDRFTDPDIQFPEQGEQHFTDLSGAGRYQLWGVAADSFADAPLAGTGAGVYEFEWERERDIDLPVVDAHSLYLESFAELGVPGGVLVLALVGYVLWLGVSAWRGAGGEARERAAALVAVLAAFAVAASLDWFWEIAALGAIFFLAAGVLAGVRAQQLLPAGGTPAATDANRRFVLATGGLAIGWLSVLALAAPTFAERELHRSQDHAAAAQEDLEAGRAVEAGGELDEAIDAAKRARSIEPWASSPYLQLGLLAELQGDYPSAIAWLDEAIEREDANWQLYYLRFRVLEQAGDGDAAQRDYDRARALNPRAPEFSSTAAMADG
jgi:hypothetical protein